VYIRAPQVELEQEQDSSCSSVQPCSVVLPQDAQDMGETLLLVPERADLSHHILFCLFAGMMKGKQRTAYAVSLS
jgi:hypothetical protein